MATGISTPVTGTSTPAPKISHPLHDLPLAKPQVTPAKEDDTSALEQMRAGKPYIAGDAYLDKLRNHALALLQKGNMELDMGRRMAMWNGFLDLRYEDRKRIFIAAPFLCEYGFNVSIGDDVFIGPNATFLDVCPIKIGSRTMIGANAQFYTPQHPIMPEERDGLNGAEWASPITIGDDVWVGGGVIILGGVTVGDGSTIGAGSVVTKDVPPRSVVVGNPAKVVKTLPLPDKEEKKGEKKVEGK